MLSTSLHYCRKCHSHTLHLIGAAAGAGAALLAAPAAAAAVVVSAERA